jgi:hypothetical protein
MPRRRGLLSTAARTAVISGTATSVAGRVARRQQQKFGAQAAEPVSRAQGAMAAGDLVGRLQQLADLKAAGALTEREYAAAKAKVLAS